jgi:hypothetical protein
VDVNAVEQRTADARGSAGFVSGRSGIRVSDRPDSLASGEELINRRRNKWRFVSPDLDAEWQKFLAAEQMGLRG